MKALLSTITVLAALFLLFFIIKFNFIGETSSPHACFRNELVKEPFKHCQKNDIIQVHTPLHQRIRYTASQSNNYKLWHHDDNEVNRYCNFNEQIIFVGNNDIREEENCEPKILGNGHISFSKERNNPLECDSTRTLYSGVNWFSCLYSGSDRDPKTNIKYSADRIEKLTSDK